MKIQLDRLIKMIPFNIKYRWTILIGLIFLQGFISHQSFADQGAFSQRIRTLAVAADLARCLAPAKARVAFPGNSDYNSARIVFQSRYAYSPAAFVFPNTVAQVQNAVTCAVKLNIGISPLSGGHSYEDYSLGGRDGVLVVDMAGFKHIKYNKKTNTAKVGSGVRLGPLKLALWNLGKVTVPAGTCPSIGVGGHALGGGWGLTSRRFGLLSDNIVELQVVTCKGTVVIANAIKNADLFWAMRGAGANSFGIVTEFTFKVHNVSAPVTHFGFYYQKNEQEQTIKAFQKWGLVAGAETTASLHLDPSGGNSLEGTYLGPSSSLDGALAIFLANAPAPTSQIVFQTDFIQTVVIDAGFPEHANPLVLNLDQNYTLPTNLFKAKDIFVKNPGLSDAGIRTFVKTLQGGEVSSFVLFDLFGGSSSIVNSVAADESAWVHRDSLYSIQMVTSWPSNPSQANQHIAFVNDLWNATRSFASSEAYQNFIDGDMPLSAYYGSNLGRLITIKKTWDPKNVFHFPQSIPLHLS